MTLFLLALLAAGGPDPDDPAVFARVRTGAWVSGGFEFDTLSLTGRRELSGRALGGGGVDVGLRFMDRWIVLGGAEGYAGGDAELTCLHLSGGYTTRVERLLPSIPDFQFSATAGLLWGRFDVDEAGFGNFDDGVGFRAGVEALFDLGRSVSLGGYVEGRFLRFDYDEETLDGDTRAGGGGLAAGLSLELRW